MYTKNTVHLTNEFAKGYYSYIADKKWSGPTVIFDLLKPFIKKNDSLLDLGIGTGLASVPFKKEGLAIDGIDSSVEMITIRDVKQIAKQIFLSDLDNNEFFFPNMEFDHIISNAFFHFVFNPEKIFSNVSLRLTKDGLFCFTTMHSGLGNDGEYFDTEIVGISG